MTGLVKEGKIRKLDITGPRIVQTQNDSFSDVGESRVWWRADFQSGSRKLKKVF